MPEANHTQFLISNLSLPKALLVAGLPSAYEQYVEAIGAEGMELTPVRSRFMGRLLYCAATYEELAEHSPLAINQDEQLDNKVQTSQPSEVMAFSRIVRAQHSSFRNDIADSGLVAQAFPTWRESLRQMRHIQRITGKLAAVLYPGFEDGKVVYNDENAPFAERTFQPTALDWHRLHLTEGSSIKDIKAAMARRGFTGITYDVLHSQIEQEGRQFQDPLGLAARLAAAGLIRSVHLSVNRLDVTGLHSELAKSTKNAKQAFIQSSGAAANTLEGEMLQVITTGWQQQVESNAGPHWIVLEDGPLRLGGAKRDHTAIIDHARELVGV